jgi:hypothetical protein
MSHEGLPPLRLDSWRSTRDAIHDYARLAGAIREGQAPQQKHEWHVTLYCTASGLTTTLVPADGFGFEVLIDLIQHRWIVTTSSGEQWSTRLRGQSAADLSDETLTFLADLDIRPEIDTEPFERAHPHDFDPLAAERFWQAMVEVDAVFKRFKAGLPGESGAVHLFPHHLDLSLQWFSGRQITTQDGPAGHPIDEQIRFGFVTGDEIFGDAYFYANPYPLPPGLMNTSPPEGGRWVTTGFAGALLPYADLLEADDPPAQLLRFLVTAQQAGAVLMR